MENAVEALKIAFAVLVFVSALSLSISSFSNASSTIDSIIQMRDKVSSYTYVEPSQNLTRDVGIETVITTMYRAVTQNENLEIYFFKSDGTTPLGLYYKFDTNKGNETVKDEAGKNIEISSINLANSQNAIFANSESASEFLDVLIGGTSAEAYQKENSKWMKYTNGLYKEFENKVFEEKLGEYKETSQTKKRVITYTLKN